MQTALIQYNLGTEHAAIDAVNGNLASRLAWCELGQVILAVSEFNFPCKLNVSACMQAALIEYNLDAVDAAINAVREALASGLDWRELGQMIKAERRAGNPVAGLIDSLALEKNKITVVLENSLDENEEDDEALTRPATKVRVNTDAAGYALLAGCETHALAC